MNNSPKVTNIVIAGLGGEGVLKASDIVAEVALDRARMGLSAFRAVPDGWHVSRLSLDTAGILTEIRGSPENAVA